METTSKQNSGAKRPFFLRMLGYVEIVGNTLQSIGLTGIPLVVGFVILSAFINMFMGSASAKWAIMAPAFVPMLMLIDPPYHPGLTQAAFPGFLFEK